jgi:hypothetical protein
MYVFYEYRMYEYFIQEYVYDIRAIDSNTPF